MVTKKRISLILSTLICTGLTGCMSTSPIMGGGQGGGTITGSAGGANSQNANTQLTKCDEALGTVSVFEDTSLPWWSTYRRRVPNLGSTKPVIRLMIQQSGCFVVVERGGAMAAMQRERALMNSGESRSGSNFGKGQMVAADFTLSPSIQFAENNTSGIKSIAGSFLGRFGNVVAGGFKQNEAATTLLLIENRSGVQVSAAVGNAKNYDFSFAGGLFSGGAFAGAGGFSNTPEGKIITASFADSYNQMVKALRNYKAQSVRGGLGKGGLLQVGGDDDPMPQATQQSSGASLQVAHTEVVHTKPVVVHTQRKTKVYTNQDDIHIDAYDEDALEDYYRALKSAVTFMSSFANFTPEQLKATGSQNMWPAWSGIVTGQLETSKIELESWPLSAKQQGWKILGKKIEQYNKLFNKHRASILNNDQFEEQLKTSIQHFDLVTKESLFGS
ncbi:CsgG/HfaB family protein [Pseudocolwellia agarivorans]|uniref:CsgG/HfaB family protein n=1 Tax=Pseudocolwellia agarivorans TaxID=1911682 RepID=UPI001115A265|nr:CsgG/HfaB family protein [Pseudocolwellia agarivorans]